MSFRVYGLKFSVYGQSDHAADANGGVDHHCFFCRGVGSMFLVFLYRGLGSSFLGSVLNWEFPKIRGYLILGSLQ